MLIYYSARGQKRRKPTLTLCDIARMAKAAENQRSHYADITRMAKNAENQRSHLSTGFIYFSQASFMICGIVLT
jgi:hypothetical protein